MPTIDQIASNALRSLIPPPRLQLSQWIEGHIILPEGVSAQPGPVELWPFQREIADAIGDPLIERVTLVKPVRVGFTTLLTSAVASFVANEPSPILCLLPAESDCRDYMVSDIEPIFAASRSVSDALGDDRDEGERNTMLSRRFAGGSLKVVAAKAPRNLRRHNVRVLFIDEADGMGATSEGSPIMLAERRTLSFPDRKIVLGSTPVHEDTSHVLRAYAQSDARVFEVPCPACGTFTEIMWQHIVWGDDPASARFKCPHCREEVEERHKSAMVGKGQWRATRPEIQGHAGFRLNALVSLHTNASWAKLAGEFVSAKDDPTTLQTFVNTILGQGWKGEGDELDDEGLAERGEDFGMNAVPANVLALTVGCDVQHDRLELTFVGWSEDGVAYVLGHRVIWGQWDDEGTWSDMDDLLRQTYPHALGGRIGVDAVAVDAGDGTTMHTVTAFCQPRTRRRIMAIKGAPGNRPMIERAGSKTKTGARLWIVGVDTIKALVFGRLSRGGTIRLSADLPRVWFEQCASERVIVKYTRGQPVRSFVRITGRRAEALDCLVYAFAARQVVNVDWERRRADLAEVGTPAPAPKPVLTSSWMNRR
jgi:phage terminase large subunit GpA-like protein